MVALFCGENKPYPLEEYLEKPCNSKLLNIVYTRNGQGRMKRRQLLETDLFRKVACLPHENGSVLLPLLHGIEHRI